MISFQGMVPFSFYLIHLQCVHLTKRNVFHLVSQESKVPSEFELKVHMLGDAMSFLKNISLDINVEDVNDLQVNLVFYGC